MNCLELRRIVTTEPDQRSLAVAEHVDQCSSCNTFIERQNQFERLLTRAVMIHPPEGLESRILLRQSMGAKAIDRSRRVKWYYSMAAGLALVAMVSTGVIYKSYQIVPLDELIVSHIEHELDSLDKQENVQLATLNEMFKPYGATVNASIGEINYAGVCEVRNTLGIHMVVQSTSGPVTVIYMPGEYVKGREPLNDDRFKGIIVPTDNGSMAIVSEDLESLPATEKRVREAITYDI